MSITPAPKVHIFWDNSNIFIPAKYVGARRDGTLQENRVRIQFDRLYQLARVGTLPNGRRIVSNSILDIRDDQVVRDHAVQARDPE